ncbi:MAG: peptidoglycan-associated lipoprotein [Lysobacteraceae bacterium]|nr:MAG: peptidoglycan-associated lipoprotein [Xanthomonadaceae bacterium]
MRIKPIKWAGLACLTLFLAACAAKEQRSELSAGASNSEPDRQVSQTEQAASESTQQATPWYENKTTQELNAEAEQRGFYPAVFFSLNQYNLSEEARRKLRANVEFLQQNPSLRLTIEGHCDERGSDDYNLYLGEERANSAADYLMALGIHPDRLRTISYGEARPVCTQSTNECWARNRRDQLVLGP